MNNNVIYFIYMALTVAHELNKYKGTSLMIIQLFLILIIALLTLCKISYIPQLIQGVFILFAFFLAINRYQIEQRTLRLQKLYFEDTFLGQSRSLENTMSQTKNNMLLTENLYILTKNILGQKELDINSAKTELLTIFDSTAANISLSIFTTDFKKETISKLLYDSGIKKNTLPRWIDKFETDSYRFSAFLKSQILLLKTHVSRLNESNTSNFSKTVNEILGQYVEENYLLIKRHEALVKLFSEITLELSSGNYKNLTKIYERFKDEKISMVVKLIDDCFKINVEDSAEIDIGNINSESVEKLKEQLEHTKEIIYNGLYNETT